MRSSHKVEIVILSDAEVESGETLDIDSFTEMYGLTAADGVKLRRRLRDGDVVDTAGYRGQGLWYFDGRYLIKTSGEYGYFMPSEAFEQVKKHGLRFFEHNGAEFVSIPDDKDIVVHQRNGFTETISARGKALAINHGDDYEHYVIDGIEYRGTQLYDHY